MPHLNSGRNLDAAEIHGENAVAFVVSSLKCHLRIKMWFRVRISEFWKSEASGKSEELQKKYRTPDPEEETMTPFLLTFTIPHLNSGRNLDAAEIHGENTVAFVISSLKCYLRIKMWFRVRISEFSMTNCETILDYNKTQQYF